MSTERDVNRIVRSWLEEGVAALPDRVLDTVLDQLPATPQRRARWPVRRFGEMNNFAKFAIAAAAVVVIAFVGLRLLPGQGSVGSVPSPSASPAPSAIAEPPSPTASPSASNVPTDPRGALPAGTYTVAAVHGLRAGHVLWAASAWLHRSRRGRRPFASRSPSRTAGQGSIRRLASRDTATQRSGLALRARRLAVERARANP